MRVIGQTGHWELGIGHWALVIGHRAFIGHSLGSSHYST